PLLSTTTVTIDDNRERECYKPCVDGDLRLVGGNTEYEGRVEVCVSQEWSTVCRDGWDITDATVVCNQLRLSNNTGYLVRYAYDYGIGRGPIFLNDVDCSGDEERLIDCEHNEISVRDCDHFQDAGVYCSPTNGDLRLVGGDTEYEGRVEVCVSREWGTVCDDGWDITDARVVCNQLRLSNNTGYLVRHAYDYGIGRGPIFLDDVDCSGDEERLIDCEHNEISVHNCNHYHDAGVYCSPRDKSCVDGDLRLVGGDTEYEGRVEVCVSQEWGTVCDDGWDITDARVVCNQLRLSNNTGYPVRYAYYDYGMGRGPIFLDDVDCSGDEERLIDCEHNGISVHDCYHYQDAGVYCSPRGLP
ncbi:Neurotrypsin, partial [Geodia barretti]